MRIAKIFAKIYVIMWPMPSYLFWNLAILFSNSSLGSEKLKQNRHSLIKSRLTDLNNFIRKRVTAKSNDLYIQLYMYNCRLSENTPASQVLQLSIEAHTGTPPAADWNRPPGRPRRNWLQQVEDIDLSVGAARIAGQDRSMCRTLRPSAGQAQQ